MTPFTFAGVVITAGYDVERGQFTGGTVNAVTKQGTNQFRGAVFGYFRGAQVAGLETTGPDFLGRAPTDFQARQYGFSLRGPIIRDRMHFFVALDRQTRNDPRPVFTRNLDPGAIRAAGVHPDTVRSIITVAHRSSGWTVCAKAVDASSRAAPATTRGITSSTHASRRSSAPSADRASTATR